MIRWFVGYDPREAVAYHTFAQSLLERSSLPISITPIALRNLTSTFRRERDPLQSNDFSFARFLVPSLCEYRGWAVFSDCDMLCLEDPAVLWSFRNDAYDLRVVQQEHRPLASTKYLGMPQRSYPRKNWSSLMLLNCGQLRAWSPEHIATAPGLSLHQFAGVPDDRIGALPRRWNYLVGVSEPLSAPAIVHWTNGGPYFAGFEGEEFAELWWQTYDRMTHSAAPALRR